MSRSKINIYARLRVIMPWEKDVVSTKARGDTTVINRTDRRHAAYEFTKVFSANATNDDVFRLSILPILQQVLKGFNAIFIAYGQTGSGKTYSVMGKPPKIQGILPLAIQYLLQQPSVEKVELSAVETFGHHPQKNKLYDLCKKKNQTDDWKSKQGSTTLEYKDLRKVILKDTHHSNQLISKIRTATHLAPTGRNPESSRGHTTYILHCTLDSTVVSGGKDELVTNFVIIDLAGSEGESVLNDSEYQSKVDQSELMARRLEAWCINHGLSQLQSIFDELRKQKFSSSVGVGLRRTMQPFLKPKSVISVLFNIAPSIDNMRSTESTLRFAETAAHVKCTPVKAKKKLNKDQLITQLKEYLQQQQDLITQQRVKISGLETELLDIKESVKEKKRGQSVPNIGSKRELPIVVETEEPIEEEDRESTDDDGEESPVTPAEEIYGSSFSSTDAETKTDTTVVESNEEEKKISTLDVETRNISIMSSKSVPPDMPSLLEIETTDAQPMPITAQKPKPPKRLHTRRHSTPITFSGAEMPLELMEALRKFEDANRPQNPSLEAVGSNNPSQHLRRKQSVLELDAKEFETDEAWKASTNDKATEEDTTLLEKEMEKQQSRARRMSRADKSFVNDILSLSAIDLSDDTMVSKRTKKKPRRRNAIETISYDSIAPITEQDDDVSTDDSNVSDLSDDDDEEGTPIKQILEMVEMKAPDSNLEDMDFEQLSREQMIQLLQSCTKKIKEQNQELAQKGNTPIFADEKRNSEVASSPDMNGMSLSGRKSAEFLARFRKAEKNKESEKMPLMDSQQFDEKSAQMQSNNKIKVEDTSAEPTDADVMFSEGTRVKSELEGDKRCFFCKIGPCNCGACLIM